MHCTQSTTVDNRPAQRDTSQKRHALRHLGPVPAMRARAVTEATPRRRDLPSRTLSDRVRTDVDAHPQEVRRRGARAGRRRSIRIRQPPVRATRRLNLAGCIANSIRFPFNGFTYFLTLFSKFFSSFPHGTCSLSVSCLYLALDGVYHPFWAAFPNNPTLRKHIVSGRPRHGRGCHPL